MVYFACVLGFLGYVILTTCHLSGSIEVGSFMMAFAGIIMLYKVFIR